MTDGPAGIVKRWGFGADRTALAENVVLRDMANSGVNVSGAEAVMRYLGAFRGAFANSWTEDTRCVAHAGQVTVEFTFHGRRQTQALGLIPAAGRDLALPMCAVYRVAVDQIDEITLYYNTLTISIQLR